MYFVTRSGSEREVCSDMLFNIHQMYSNITNTQSYYHSGTQVPVSGEAFVHPPP